MNRFVTRSLLLLSAFLLTCQAGISQNITPLYTAGNYIDSLWVLDTTNHTLLSGHEMLYPGFTPDGANGFAVNPLTGVTYAICKDGANPRRLAIMDPVNFAYYDIGSLGEQFAALAFHNDTLFGITGDGSTTSESLFRIDQKTAATTFVTGLGNGSDGETFTWNDQTNSFYHLSGLGTANTDEICEQINATTFATTSVTLSGYDCEEVFGSVYVGNGNLLLINIDGEFIDLSSTGVATFAATNPIGDDVRGLAFRTTGTWPIGGNAAVCTGDTVTLQASAGSAYQWYVNGSLIPGATSSSLPVTTGGAYNCMITFNGSTDSSQVGTHVTVDVAMVSIVQGDTTFACPGDSAMITTTGNGTTFQWFLNGASVPGATAPTLSTVTTGVYTVEATTASGCVVTSGNSTIVATARQILVPLGPITFCEGDTFPLSAIPTDGTNYQWYRDGVLIPGATMPTVMVSDSGDYSLVATLDGCTDSTNGVPVIQMPRPVANFTVTADTVFINDVVTFTETGMHSNSTTWNFGDGNSGQGSSVQHSYPAPGNYSVTQTASNFCGIDTLSIIIVVLDTSVSLQEQIPGLQLLGNFPNPFAEETRIVLQLAQEMDIKLEVYNLMGKRISVLHTGYCRRDAMN